MTKPWTDALVALGACEEAVEWAKTQPDYGTAWTTCTRGDWLLWLAGKHAGKPWSEARKPLVRAACACARLALLFVRGPEALAAIDAAERWTRGEAIPAAVRAAAAAAYAAAAHAATDAAAYAAHAAAYAAHAAAYAAHAAHAAADAAYADAAYAAAYADAAAYAAAAAARPDVLAACADLVRQHVARPALASIPRGRKAVKA